MVTLLDLTPTELATRLGGPQRASAVYSVLRAGGDPYRDLPRRAADRLRSAVSETPLLVPKHVEVAEDGTAKLLLPLLDGLSVETVLIPSDRRTTLCVSSQVGCARGCCFCRTASMGLVRNMSCGEIVGQVVVASRFAVDRGMPPLRNVVFMGMGEPLDNVAFVENAIEVITSPHAFGFGPGHVTLSTVGPSPAVIRRASTLPVRIAWSLHAADDALRQRLVPTARHPVSALRDAFAFGLLGRRAALFVEVALIESVNDGAEHARAIARLFDDFPVEVRMNLLPVNPIDVEGIDPSPAPRVIAFRDELIAAGYLAIIRRARGADRSSACGQLAVSVAQDRRDPRDARDQNGQYQPS